MLEQHFGLSGHPFLAAGAAPAVYLSRTHREALAALEWGLQEPSGFTLVTGEAGSGKTTLIYSLLGQAHPEARIVHLCNPKLSFREMLYCVLAGLGVATRRSRLAMLDAFSAALMNLLPNRRVALIVDEAQAVDDETLEELRLLTNLPAANVAPLQILLVGQPDLVARLRSPVLRQLNERIGARAHLERLTIAEIGQYVDYRLRAVGGRADALFTIRALHRIAVCSQGLPRRINVLCHNAMLLAYVANRRRVDGAMVRASAREYDDWTARGLAIPPPTSRRWLRRLGPLAAASLLGLAAWHGWSAAGYETGRAKPAHSQTIPAPNPAIARHPAAVPHIHIGAAPLNSTAAITPPPTINVAQHNASDLASTPRPSGNQAPAVWNASARERARGLRITVRAGDTVADLALRYLGSSAQTTLTMVARANPQIADLNLIYPGQTVLLPNAAGAWSR